MRVCVYAVRACLLADEEELRLILDNQPSIHPSNQTPARTVVSQSHSIYVPIVDFAYTIFFISLSCFFLSVLVVCVVFLAFVYFYCFV